MSITKLVYHPDYIKHKLRFDHPEKPERVSKTTEHVKKNQKVEEQIEI